ncbi:MAG: hypothetical protein JJ971_16380, partial [Balneolaceae bacterium]|nr:hypothetical protein [Balneolaceae bacterium]
ATASTGAGGIYITETDAMSISSINAGTGNVELESAGTITDVGGTETTTDITAAGVTIRNATGVGVDAGNSLNLDADTLTITTLSGDAFLTEANGIGLGTVNVVANALTLEAITGNITDNTSAVTAGNLSLTATANGASIGASGAANDINVTLSGTLSATASDGTGGIFIGQTGTLS